MENKMPLQTTTIGAFPKPKYVPVQDWFLAQKSTAEREASPGLLANWQPGEYEAALQAASGRAEELFVRATREVIDDQIGAGIDVPTDGEVRRENYIFYQCRRLAGISFSQVTRKSVRQGSHSADVPTITGPISLTTPRLSEDWRTGQNLTTRPIKITLPGPMTIADSVADAYYHDERKLGADLADALNVEVRALADAGCQYIQVDEPVFARKPEEALAYGFDHLERTFTRVPEHVIRVVHVCCGYPNALDSQHYRKADARCYLQIADAIERSSIDQISIEDAHRHNDLSLLEHFVSTRVVLGVVDVARSRVETVEEIRERLKAALEHIDADRLIAAPDCGLGFLTREMALAKLMALTQAARQV